MGDMGRFPEEGVRKVTRVSEDDLRSLEQVGRQKVEGRDNRKTPSRCALAQTGGPGEEKDQNELRNDSEG